MTFVLIHGGGSTGRFWDRLLPLLPGPALAVDLPGRGQHPAPLESITVDDEVSSVLSDIASAPLDDALVLVAHSSGGLVVPGVASALGDRVERIVLNAALVPPEGGCGLDCMQPQHAAGLRVAVETAQAAGNAVTLPGPPVDRERFRRTYGGDPLSDNDLDFVTDPVRLVADTVHHYFQPLHWSKVPAGIPVTYVVNDRDRPIPTPLQDEVIGRLPVAPTVIRLDGGHIPVITDPARFAEIL